MRSSSPKDLMERKRAKGEAKFRDNAESASEFRLLADTIPTLVWRARPGGDIEYVNKRVLEYFGAPLGEIVGWGWAERVHPDDATFKMTNWLNSLETKNPHDVVCRFRGADSRYRWFNVRGEPLRARDGSVLSWYGVLIDVDDQRRVEEALRESEYKLRQIIETVPALLWSSAPDGELTDVNQRVLEDYFGLRFDGLQHRGWMDLLHPDDIAETASAFAHAIQSGTSYQAMHRLRRAEGEYRWHQSRSEPLRDPQGNIIQWYGLTVDIDEAKKAEDRLRRSEAHLAEAQRLSHTGASVYNATALLYWSEEMFRIMGFDPRDGLPGREAMWQRIHPDDRNQLRANVELAKSGKGGFSSECRIVLPDGTVKYIESLREPVFSADGELVEMLATHVDVTERKRAADSLRESEAKFRDYAETASDWFWETGPDYKFTLLPENAFGSHFADRIGSACWDHAVDLEIEPEKWRLVRATLDSRKPFRDFVYCTVSGDGSPMYVKASGKPVFDSSGEYLGYRGTGSDVTAIVRAQEAVRERTEALRRSEAYLAEAQRLSHTGTWVLNPITMQYLYWSDECYRIWGFDPLQGLPSREALWQRIDDRDRVWDEVQEALRHKRDYSGEFKIVLPNGTVKCLAATCHHLFSADGELVEVIGTNVDVTERKRVEDRLRVQHTVAQGFAGAVTIEEATPRILRAVGECLGWDVGALWRVDREVGALRCIELWHKGSIEVPEFKRADWQFTFNPGVGLPGRVWSSLKPAYIPDVVPDKNLPRGPIAEREGLHAAIGFPILLGSEVLGVIEFFSREIKQPDQELLDMVATIGSQIGQFIERKRAEEALMRSKDYLAEAQKLTHTGSWAWDPRTEQVLYCSEEMFRIYGLDQQSSLPSRENFRLQIHPEDREWVKERFEESLRTKIDSYAEYRVLLLDGTVRHISASGHPVLNEDGELIQFVGTAVDVTKRKQAEESLRESEANLAHMNRVSMLGELAASLSHEIAQPIASARNNARAAQNFLNMQPPDVAEVSEALSCLVGDADRAGEIIDRIREQIKKEPPRKERFDLNVAINEVIALARSVTLRHGVSVQTRLAEGVLSVLGDRVQLQQVLLNLALNAAEAMESVEEGARELSISTEEDQAGVVVAVRDSGPGIDPEHLEQIFDAFYTTKPNGTGMGLAICRSIIHAHGGQLWAERNEPRGAVFRFTLPGAERELTTLPQASLPSREPRRRIV